MLLKVGDQAVEEVVALLDGLGVADQRAVSPRPRHRHVHAPPVTQEAHLALVVAAHHADDERLFLTALEAVHTADLQHTGQPLRPHLTQQGYLSVVRRDDADGGGRHTLLHQHMHMSHHRLGLPRVGPAVPLRLLLLIKAAPRAVNQQQHRQLVLQHGRHRRGSRLPVSRRCQGCRGCRQAREGVAGHGGVRGQLALVQLVRGPLHDGGVHAVLHSQHLAGCAAVHGLQPLKEGAAEAPPRRIIADHSGRQLQVVPCQHRTRRLEQGGPGGGLQGLSRLVHHHHVKHLLVQVPVQNTRECAGHHLGRLDHLHHGGLLALALLTGQLPQVLAYLPPLIPVPWAQLQQLLIERLDVLPAVFRQGAVVTAQHVRLQAIVQNLRQQACRVTHAHDARLAARCRQALH
mmetsp:Transcript_17167/g.37064  ORF Transcript_17167/g.37064 Transcript_17167/m.37064 type:complete len:403 (-) Transcript_17167:988-2196(-)